jgi:tetratricopeptide (TPR) repeat protein
MKPSLRVSLVLLFSLMSVPVKADTNLGHKLGTIRFDVSGTDAAKAHVVRGVKLLHHMMYVEADREFASALQADPECALAYWGRAMSIIHPLWPDAPDATELKQGWEFTTAGLARNPRTPRERAYLETMETYFRDAAKRDHPSRLKAADEAWAKVARDYPQDLDAAAFSALFHLAPARFLPKDKSHRIQLEAGATIQRILAEIPDHPGAQHYKIHAFDFPLLADRALEICDSYGSIAPDVPHALHMPTHIYTRRGQWEKSIEFNRRAADAALKLSQGAGTTNSHYPHSLDYLAYAYLQRGQYREADAIRRKVLAMTGPYHASNRTAIAFAFAAIPARFALERQDWTAAAQLELRRPASFPWGDAFLHCDSIVHFARAIGAIRSGQLDTARREIEELDRLNRRIAATHPASYWSSQAETQTLATRAWLSLKEGKKEDAVTLMRRAADLEATTDKEAVTPGEVLPAGELLGDLLIEVGRTRDALAAYEKVLESSPNRLNTLYGAGRAAELSGDAGKALSHYEQLVAVAAEADAGLKPVQHARTFMTNRATKRAGL